MVLPLSMATTPWLYFLVVFVFEEPDFKGLSQVGPFVEFSLAKATKAFIMGSSFCIVWFLAAAYASFPNDLTMTLSPF